MRYTNTECLQQMLKALQQGIIPELPMNSTTQVAVGALTLGLAELLKRETVTPNLLNTLIPQGLQIAQDQIALAEKIAGVPAESFKQKYELILAMKPSTENVNGLNKKYERLMELLEQTSQALVSGRDRATAIQNSQISDRLKQVADWEYSFYEKNKLPVPEKCAETETPASSLDKNALESFLCKQMPAEKTVKVENIKRVLGGYGKETWFFDLTTESGRDELVVRRNTTGNLIGKGPFSMRQEFSLVSVLYQEGVLVPEPLWFGSEEEPGFDTAFYIVRRVRGKPMGTFMASNPDIPEKVWLQAAEQLAKIHSVPIQKFNDFFIEFYGEDMLNCSVSKGLRYYLDFWLECWENFSRVPSPMEIYQFDWLYTNLPENESPASVVHGDFGAHNMLYDGEELTAILDWEGSLFGSPALDLAYTRKWVSANMDWQRFVAHYEACGGAVIDKSEYAYGNAYVYTRTSSGTNASSSSLKFHKNADYKDMVLGIQFWPEMMKTALDSAAGK